MRFLAFALALSLSGGAVATEKQEFDWNRTGDRETIDRWMRKLSEQCGQLGFTPLAAPDPTVMEKRLYARLLLKSEIEAKIELERWAGYIVAMTDLGKQDYQEAAAEQAGAALTAATVDPTSHDAAKRKYVEALAGALRPFLRACTSAAADEFVGANYLTGSGSLSAYEAKAAAAFDKSVDEFDQDRKEGVAPK